MTNNITTNINDVADKLGVTKQHLRMGIRTGVYPFGVYIKEERSKRGKYIIYKQRLKEYLKGSDIKRCSWWSTVAPINGAKYARHTKIKNA